MEAEHRPSGRRVSVPLPPVWLVFSILALGAIAALVYADRQYWHWYALDRAALTTLAASVENTADDVENLDDGVSDLRRDLRDKRAGESSFGLVEHPELALQRIAGSVAILALVANYGGEQSTGSPAGQACIAFLMKGEGSVTDCGWRHGDE